MSDRFWNIDGVCNCLMSYLLLYFSPIVVTRELLQVLLEKYKNSLLTTSRTMKVCCVIYFFLILPYFSVIVLTKEELYSSVSSFSNFLCFEKYNFIMDNLYLNFQDFKFGLSPRRLPQCILVEFTQSKSTQIIDELMPANLSLHCCVELLARCRFDYSNLYESNIGMEKQGGNVIHMIFFSDEARRIVAAGGWVDLNRVNGKFK